MKRFPFAKVVAFAGWVVWPIFLAAIFTGYRFLSQMGIESWAEYAGALQARVWFQEGKYRLMELTSEEKPLFTGKKEGEYEIWNWRQYTKSSWMAAGNADQQFVEALNRQMRQFAEAKQKEKDKEKKQASP